MKYDVYWYDDAETIVYAKYPDNWTWDDFYLIRKAVHQLVDTGDAPRVDFVADMLTARMPKGSPFSHSFTVTRHKHPRTHLLIIVSQQNIIKAMTNLATKLSPDNMASFRLVSTIDDAVTLIHEERQNP